MTRRPIQRVELALPLAGLRAPRTIDFISDIHLRSERNLEEFIQATRMPRSETLFLGGDYVERASLAEPLFDHLRERYARIFAVKGNNDVPCVCGEHLPFMNDEIIEWDGVHVLGTRDPARDKPELPRLPQGPLLVLSHSPDILFKLPPERKLLILAGHVHGGQYRIPGMRYWWSHTRIGHRYGEGHVRRGENDIFVGRGIGWSSLPLRNVPREIYTITLEPYD